MEVSRAYYFACVTECVCVSEYVCVCVCIMCVWTRVCQSLEARRLFRLVMTSEFGERGKQVGAAWQPRRLTTVRFLTLGYPSNGGFAFLCIFVSSTFRRPQHSSIFSLDSDLTTRRPNVESCDI